ncbi:MAG: radical SAM protein [Candidatus Binatia bacterium]
MTTIRNCGRERIAELEAQFPAVPRPIVIKSDVLREGVQGNALLGQIGPLSFPHFLLWNSDHPWNPVVKGTDSGGIRAIPWNFILEDGHTPVVCRIDPASPYEIRLSETGSFVLHRDGEPIEPVRFERGARWLFDTTTDGTMMGSVFLSWTREALLGCALRYCEYTKSGDQCRYCCLDAEAARFHESGFKMDMAVKPADAAEAYRAAEAETGGIRQVAFTGGSLLNTKKEMERYIALYAALRDARDEMHAHTQFYACVTAPPDRGILNRLHEAGLTHIAPNMDCWEEHLWPVIVPGKHKFVGRQYWIDSLLMCLEVYGVGMVGSAFVVGPEMVQPYGFASLEEGVASWARCFEWCTSHQIIPMLIPWQKEVGSPWEHKQPPPTEYTLAVFQERHRRMQDSGLYGLMEHNYFMSQAWDTNADFRRLAYGCTCPNCTPPAYTARHYVDPDEVRSAATSGRAPTQAPAH